MTSKTAVISNEQSKIKLIAKKIKGCIPGEDWK